MDDLQGRISNTEQQFELKKQERQEHLDAADLCLAEMNQLKGEYKVLTELLADDKPNKTVDTIDVTPEEL